MWVRAKGRTPSLTRLPNGEKNAAPPRFGTSFYRYAPEAAAASRKCPGSNGNCRRQTNALTRRA